jgi:hypothetical protein
MMRVAALIVVSFCVFTLMAFTTRVDTTHYVPFSYGAAAGWLNDSTDAREFALKGAHTVNKFGANLDLDQTEESIWDADDLPAEGNGPARCFANMSSAANLYVSSDDATDATVEIAIEVLDAKWDLSTVTMDLGAASAGTGTVFTQIGSTTLLRVNRAYATDTAFTGNIYIHKDSTDAAVQDGIPDTVATDVVAVVTAGENQTLQACYSVPNDYEALMTQFCLGNIANVGAVTFRLRRSVDGGADRTTELISLAADTYACTVHDPPIYFAEKTDIELTGDGAAANNDVSGTFDLLLLPSGG